MYVVYADTMPLSNSYYLQNAAGNQDAHMGASNRRRMSNMVCLLLVQQWLQLTTKSATCYVKVHLRFLCNGGRVTHNASLISDIVASVNNQISDTRPYSASQITF
jgi:hypothetical protein